MQFLKSSLVVKLAVLLLCTVALGFSLSAAVNARMQVRTMDRLHRQWATGLAQGLSAGVRNAMLAGNGITVRSLLDEARERFSQTTVRVYGPTGARVFEPPAPPPPPDAIPPHVRALLADAAAPADDGVLAVPNERRCQRCHEGGPLRGVLTARLVGEGEGPAGADAAADVLADVIDEAFVQIMTAEHTERLDDYFSELVDGVASLDAAAVFDAEGFQRFGVAGPLAADGEVAAGLRPAFDRLARDGGRASAAGEGTLVRLVALPNDARCQGCHEAEPAIRGVLALSLRAAAPAGASSLLPTLHTSLQHVMLSGLGSLAGRFMDRAAATGALGALTLHDAEGRLVHDAFAEPSPPGHVAEVLRSGIERPDDGARLTDEAFVFVSPMANEPACQRCHGTDDDLRGAIEITLDTRAAAAERQALLKRSGAFALGTVLLVVLVLYLGIRLTVVAPVREIAGAAQRVGEGDLDARVDVRSSDEIGRLAHRFNDMVQGLRHKLELSKFVSRGTVDRIHASEGEVQRGGERRKLTVLFSDIRGFTAWSERHEPEEVVEMLNRYLDAQARVVARHGGDIDKYVGDELMARFAGPGMEQRAVACAVEMVEAVAALTAADGHADDGIAVGVGVNCGEMVLGAMGSEARMDFTVIGDAVNLGARLCSAAGRGEVVVSEAVVRGAGPVDGVTLTPREPLHVKGKAAPVAAFDAARDSAERDA